MDKELKQKWMIALRSGEYKQNKGALMNRAADQEQGATTAYCCLAVLDQVAGATYSNWEELHIRYPATEWEYSVTHEEFLDGRSVIKLIQLNDGQPGSDFNQIADWIEENL